MSFLCNNLPKAIISLHNGNTGTLLLHSVRFYIPYAISLKSRLLTYFQADSKCYTYAISLKSL